MTKNYATAWKMPCPTHLTVPSEGVYLELGCLDIRTIIKARRINYLHYLVNQDPNSMLYKFFCTQWKYSCKNDWTLQVKQDLSDFEISADFNELKKKSIGSFKQLVRRKAKEYAFYTFLEKQASHSKLDNICYTELKLQDYLENMSANEAQTVFSYRTRMANFKENYRGPGGPQPCPLCNLHLDTQSLSFQCPLVKNNVKLEGKYNTIFSNKIDKTLVKTLLDINRFRKEFMESRQINQK